MSFDALTIHKNIATVSDIACFNFRCLRRLRVGRIVDLESEHIL